MMPKLGNVHTIPCWQGKPACGSTLCLLYLYNIYYIIYILYYYIYIVLPVIPGRFFIVNTFDLCGNGLLVMWVVYWFWWGGGGGYVVQIAI